MEYDISTKVLVRSMGTFARYASIAQMLPLAETDTTIAKHALRSTVTTLKNTFSKNTHLIVQIGLFFVVIAALSAHVTSTSQTTSQAAVATQGGINTAVIDELSSSEVAAVVAITTDAIVSQDVVAKAEHIDASESVSATSEEYLTKPSVAVTDDASSQGMTTHKVASGESLKSIAKQYGISVETIKWANNLDSNSVKKGEKLRIPPVNGVVYTVASGDTAAKIADKFSADADRIIAFNDAEIDGLKAGQKIIIPGGEKNEPEPNTPTGFANSNQPSSRVQMAAGIVVTGKAGPPSGGASYYPGQCTWYAAAKGGMPRMLGNANQWDERARALGMNVGSRPTVGAVAQSNGGSGFNSYYGHVAIVEAVSADGSRIKYSDMNGLGGPGGIGYSGWVPASTFHNYITR